MRVLLRLAESPQLPSNTQLVKRLTITLVSAECNPNEMCILVEIFAKLSLNCVLTVKYPHFLQAAEARMDHSVHALRVLARQRLPVPTTRYAHRLLNVLLAALASGNETVLAAAAELLVKASRREPYVRQIVDQNFHEKLCHALTVTKSLDVFGQMLEVMKNCEMKATPDVIKSDQQITRGARKGQADAASSILSLLGELK